MRAHRHGWELRGRGCNVCNVSKGNTQVQAGQCGSIRPATGHVVCTVWIRGNLGRDGPESVCAH